MLRVAGFALWDIQMTSPHTARFGAREIAPPSTGGACAEALKASRRGPLRPPTGG